MATTWIGTSGYQYPAWRGRFYPPALPEHEMLAFYAARFPTVEINYTSYRWPTEKALRGWRDGTPEPFRVCLRMHRRVTDVAKLRDTARPVADFWRVAQALGDKLGPVLVTLGPEVEKDLDVLREFVEARPPAFRAAVELRNPSWHEEAVFEILHAGGLALCISESDVWSTPLVLTADYAYLRLRRAEYAEDALGRWADLVAGWSRRPDLREVYVYFMHEDQASGPAYAASLTRQVAERLAPR